MSSDNILKNFKVYDDFLSKCNTVDKKNLLSLKMMYSIHMENNTLNNIFVAKQLFRFILKLLMIPFVKTTINGIENKNAILSEGDIEKDLSERLNISLIDIKKRVTFNIKFFKIYKKVYKLVIILFNENSLKKRHILSLLHRLIDYLIVYHTVEINNIKLLLIENDRLPSNLALIHRLNEKNIKTVKYDNWLIGPINHNDIYCKYYFYPSFYHRDIIEKFSSNKNLTYIKGGFLNWDRLKKYVAQPKKKIIYFTQFGIDILTHIKHIQDIQDIIKSQNLEYELIVKIHPRENIQKYKTILTVNKNIKLLDRDKDSYTLISEANFCFSIFSTISLEAKHIMNNSYFLNYKVDEFDIVDYSKLNLDVIVDKKMLENVLIGNYKPIEQNKFIEINNCLFPKTITKIKELIAYE